jgi:hypothetical protein
MKSGSDGWIRRRMCERARGSFTGGAFGAALPVPVTGGRTDGSRVRGAWGFIQLSLQGE